MAKFNAPKPIRKEDYPAKYSDLIPKLGFALNDFLLALFNALNSGKLDNSNLNRRIQDIDIEINGSGDIVGTAKIRGGLITKIVGINLINTINKNDSATFATNHPGITWTLASDVVTIENVSGLQNNSTYTLTLELIGE